MLDDKLQFLIENMHTLLLLHFVSDEIYYVTTLLPTSVANRENKVIRALSISHIVIKWLKLIFCGYKYGDHLE